VKLKFFWRNRVHTDYLTGMSQSTTDDSNQFSAFSLDDKPVTVISAYQMREQYGHRWECTAKCGNGRHEYLELSISDPGYVCVTASRSSGRDLLLKTNFPEVLDAPPVRHCDIITLLRGEFEFDSAVVLHWAILDLDPEFVERAISAGADLREVVDDGLYPVELVSAVAASLSEGFQRYFRSGDPSEEVARIVKNPWNANYQVRALLIHKMLLAAGSLDGGAFRKAVQDWEFDYAHAELLAGIAIDARAPGGETPLVNALLCNELPAVRWLLRHGAKRNADTGYRSQWVEGVDPRVAGKLFHPDWELAPLTAACVADFPEGFRLLLECGDDRPETKDFENLLGSCVPPAWALEAMAGSGFDFNSLENLPFRDWLKMDGAEVCASFRKIAEIAGPEIFNRLSFGNQAHPLQYFWGEPESHGRIEVLRTLLEAGVPANPLPGERQADVFARSLKDAGYSTEEEEKHVEDLKTRGILCQGSSPLHCAVKAGNTGIEALLLEFGADPDLQDALGRKPEAFRKLPTLCNRPYVAFFDGLNGDGNPRAWAEEHAPELLAASAEDKSALLELMKLWLDDGGDPKPDNLLVRAVNNNALSLVELLLRSDFSPEQRGYALLAAMEMADQLYSEAQDFLIYRGSFRDPGPAEGSRETAAAICKLLRDGGTRDFTLLCAAARSGDIAGIRKEVEAGTPVNFLVEGWGSPLLAAIAGRQPAAVRALLDAGADPNLHFDTQAPDSVEISPCQAALKTGDAEMVKELLQAGADLDKGGEVCANLFNCKIKDSETAARLFAGRKAFPDWKNSAGETGVHLLDRESLHVCGKFIPTEALNVRSYRGETPVLRACQDGNIAKVFDLLDAGANPSCYGAINHDGYLTPGSYHSMANHLKIVFLNPMHAAILSGNILFVERMLEAGGRFDLPAFSVPVGPSNETRARLRKELEGFWPKEFPQDQLWRQTFTENCLEHGINNEVSIPQLKTNETLLFLNFLLEDPARAAVYKDFVVPLSCLDLAVKMGSTVMREMVLSGRNLEGTAFFAALRGDIARLREVLAEEQALLNDPEADRPRTYPYILKIRRIETAMIAKVWEETGEMPPLSDKDSAMDCLRYASEEFDGKFLQVVEKIEETGELSMEEFAGGLAEALTPGSTVDLGKFFANALSTLARFDKTCAQW